MSDPTKPLSQRLVEHVQCHCEGEIECAALLAELRALEADSLMHARDRDTEKARAEKAERERDAWKAHAEEAEQESFFYQRLAAARARIAKMERETVGLHRFTCPWCSHQSEWIESSAQRDAQEMEHAAKCEKAPLQKLAKAEAKLAAAQAREAKLRDALMEIASCDAACAFSGKVLARIPRDFECPCDTCASFRKARAALSDVPPPPNPPKIPDSSTAQLKSPFGWERLAVPGSRWCDKLGDASCMKEPGHDGPCVPIKQALAEDAPPALAHTVKEVAERFLPGVPESTIRMWISQAEECRAEAVRRSKVANPCPICTARASEDGLTRYAPKITEQLIDAKRAAPAMHLPAQMEELHEKLLDFERAAKTQPNAHWMLYRISQCLRLVPVQHDDNMQAVEVEPACGPKHGADAPCDHCRKHGHTTPCIACACGEKTSSEVQP